MKRYKYVVAATCLLLSAAGFVGLYATNQTKEQEEQVKNENIVEESEDIILGTNIFDTESESEEEESERQEVVQKEPVEDEAPVGNVTPAQRLL